MFSVTNRSDIKFFTHFHSLSVYNFKISCAFGTIIVYVLIDVLDTQFSKSKVLFNFFTVHHYFTQIIRSFRKFLHASGAQYFMLHEYLFCYKPHIYSFTMFSQPHRKLVQNLERLPRDFTKFIRI